MGTFEAKVVNHGFSGESRCVLCGEGFFQDQAVCTLFEDGKRLGDLCPKCLAGGSAGAAQRTKANAQRMRERAESLDSLAEAVSLISRWCSLSELREAEQAPMPECGSAQSSSSGSG